MDTALGDPEPLIRLWWALEPGSCLGGNGSLIGASAKLIVAGFAQRAGHPVAFVVFMTRAFGMMLISIVISHVYLYLRCLSRSLIKRGQMYPYSLPIVAQQT